MSKFIKIAIWFILFMAGLSISLSMISAANTVENLLGCVVLGLPLWMILVIVLLGIIPWLNITLFVIFIVLYFIFSLEENWDELDNRAIVLSLDGGNIITKCLLKVKELLCWKT